MQSSGNHQGAELQRRKGLVRHLPSRHEIAARDFWRIVCGGEGGFDDLLTGRDFDLSAWLFGGVQQGDFIAPALRQLQIPHRRRRVCGKDGPIVVPTLTEELRSAFERCERGEQLGYFAEGDGKAQHATLRGGGGHCEPLIVGFG